MKVIHGKQCINTERLKIAAYISAVYVKQIVRDNGREEGELKRNLCEGKAYAK